MRKVVCFIILGLLTGCGIVPDISPNTSEGSSIVVVDIYDDISFNCSPHRIEYNLDNVGQPEIVLDIENIPCSWPGGYDIRGYIKVNGKILLKLNEPTSDPFSNITNVYFDQNILPGIDVTNGIYVNSKLAFMNRYSILRNSESKENNDIKYILIQINFPDGIRHGWIEFQGNDFTQHFVLTRIGVAEEPGFVLRAGQE